MRLPKPVKILLWIAIIVVVLIIAAGVTLKLVLTKEKLMAMVRPRIEQAIQREVSIGDVSLSLWPSIGIGVDDLTVANREGFGPEPFLHLDRFLLKVKLIPLLSKRIEVSTIVLHRPQISVEIAKDGTTNYDDLTAGPKEEAEEEPTKKGPSILPVSFDRFAIDDGRVSFVDRRKGTEATLGKIDQEMSLSLQDGLQRITTQGKLTVDDVSLAMQGLKGPVEGISLSLEHHVVADASRLSVEIYRLAVAVNKISLALDGKVGLVGLAPQVDLNFSGDFSIQDALAAVPAGMAPRLSEYQVSGGVKVNGTATGVVQKGTLPQVSGTAKLRDLAVTSPRLPQPFKLSETEIAFTDKSLNVPWLKAALGELPIELRATVENFKDPAIDAGLRVDLDLGSLGGLVQLPPETAISGRVKIDAGARGRAKQPEALSLSGQVALEQVEARTPTLPVPAVVNGQMKLAGDELTISSMKVSLGGSPASVSGTVGNLLKYAMAKGDLKGNLAGDVDLGVVKQMGKLPSGTSISGGLAVKVGFKGRPDNMERMSLSGGAELKNVAVATPSLAKPVEKLSGKVALSGPDLDLSDFRLNVGRSSLSLAGQLKSFLPFVMAGPRGSVRPRLTFTITSPLVDLDELLPKGEKKTEKTRQTPAGVVPVPPVEASGKVSLDRVIFQRIEMTGFNAIVQVAEAGINIQNVQAQVYTGTVGGNVTLGLEDPQAPNFDIDLKAHRLQANDFMSALTSFDDHLYGQMDMNATFSGQGAEAEAVKQTLRANGTATISGGRIENWDLLNQLAGMLKLPQFKTLSFRTLQNSFRIQNQRIFFDEFNAQGNDADWSLTGSAGFDGSLDYRVTATLSPELSTRFDAAGDLSQYFKNDQGRVVLDVDVKGTSKNPRFTLDTSKAEQRMKERLKQEADEKIKELKDKGKDLLEGLFRK